MGGDLRLAKAHQLRVEVQEGVLGLGPASLIQGVERLPERHGAAQPTTDAVEGRPHPFPVLVGGQPVLLGHAPQGHRQALWQAVMIQEKLTIALRQKAG